MQWVDIALAGVLALSVIVGLVRGFVFEVLSLLGWFAAYFAAQWLAPDVAPHIPVGKPGSGINHAAAFAAVFIAALLVWALGSRLVRLLVHATPLSLPDRLLGAVFGLLRGLVLLLAAATVVSLTPLSKWPAWQASHGAQWLQVALEGLRPVLPPQLLQHLPASPGAVR
jgi:membrane protein required for colicin V production